MMLTQNQTPQTFLEKPGIGCISSVHVESAGPSGGGKVLLVSGGFDHRVRVVSARTLKLLVTLNFH